MFALPKPTMFTCEMFAYLHAQRKVLRCLSGTTLIVRDALEPIVATCRTFGRLTMLEIAQSQNAHSMVDAVLQTEPGAVEDFKHTHSKVTD